MTGALSALWEQGLCIRCKKLREKGNDTFWCKPCSDASKESHTRNLSQ